MGHNIHNVTKKLKKGGPEACTIQGYKGPVAVQVGFLLSMNFSQHHDQPTD